jgi:hypothetical protein
MVDGIEPHQSEDNEIGRDDDVQQSRQYQNQNTGDERDKRRDMGGGDDHGFASGVVKGFEDATGAAGHRQSFNAQAAVWFYARSEDKESPGTPA